MPSHSSRVVVVDDDDDFASGLKALLQANGYDVRVASGPAQALEVIAHHRPLCVMLDLGLPDVSAGLQLARDLRFKYGPTLVVIVITGWTDTELKTSAQATGVDIVLHKPINAARLEKMLPPLHH